MYYPLNYVVILKIVDFSDYLILPSIVVVIDELSNDPNTAAQQATPCDDLYKNLAGYKILDLHLVLFWGL